MATVFQTFKTRTDPATGKRVRVLDSKGRPVPHDRWRFEYTDFQGNRRNATGTTSKTETQTLANRKQSQEQEIRLGLRPAPRSSDTARTRPVKDVIGEYLSWGNAQGGRGGRPWGRDHALKRKQQLDWWRERLNLETLADLDGALSRVEAALRELSESMAPKTCFNYRDSICAFCDWAVERGLLDSDPLNHLAAWDKTPQTRRRALTVPEIKALLSKSRPHFRLLYETAILTGLRRHELMSLQVHNLNVDMGGLDLEADWTKNRKPGFQPLPPDLMQRLAQAAQGKAPSDPLLRVPYDTSKRLYEDLKRADIEKSGPGGKVDFHSLRTTFVNLVLDSGAGVKESMDLARHSTPDMTLNIYGRSRWERKAELVGSIADRVSTEPEIEEETITEPEPKVVGWESVADSRSLLALPRGIEPLLSD